MRAIDADALMEASKYEFWQDGNAITPIGEYILGKFRQLIRNMPTIEPEQIVRCKDCEYGDQDEYGRWYCRGFGCQVGDEDGSGFCSDAERKK